jgi:hypothetical protein
LLLLEVRNKIAHTVLPVWTKENNSNKQQIVLKTNKSWITISASHTNC